MMQSVFSAHGFDRLDEGDDAAFYATPRLVTHIDQPATATIGRILSQLIAPEAEILDLMSSWRSHLPPDLRPRRVVGLGLNGTEMRENDQLSAWILHDLNQEPTLPFEDASFDAVINTVSIQYMTRPFEVFREVGRILRPGAPCIVIFSNRMFPTKAIQVWRSSTEQQRVAIVRQYFEESGLFCHVQSIERSTNRPPQQSPLSWLALSGDPVYVVSGRRIAG